MINYALITCRGRFTKPLWRKLYGELHPYISTLFYIFFD